MGSYTSTDMIRSVACVAVPCFLVVGVPLLLASAFATRRAGISLLHFCLYLTLIAVFDFFELVLLSVNALGRSFFDIHLLDSITLMSRTACVVTTLSVNSLRHLQSALLITLAVDAWRFARHPVKVNRTLRSEWVKNCSILITTTCLFVNCQYFWTFDVSEHDNRVLHGRLVNKAYECSYAMNLLSRYYTTIVWPLIDLSLGNLLPTAVALLFGAWAAHLIRRRWHRCGGAGSGLNLLTLYQSHFIDVRFVFQVLSAAAAICLVCAVLALPETVYALWKFVRFFKDKDNRHNPSSNSQARKRLLTMLSTEAARRGPQADVWRDVEPYHQAVDAVILYCRLLSLIFKPLILFGRVRRLRQEVSGFLRRRCRSVGKRIGA